MTRSRLLQWAVATTTLVAVFGLGGASTAVAAKPKPATPIAPCIGEDGFGPAPCIWDARTRGNGIGDSYISPHGNGEDLIYIH